MELGKLFFAAAVGIVVGGYIEPMITPHIPDSITKAGKIVPLAIHATIGGATTVGVYVVIRKVA